MKLFFEQETEDVFSFDPRTAAESVIRETLRVLNCPFDVQVSLLLVDENTVRQMNRENRGIDAVTDVLSFPMIPFDTPCDWDADRLDAEGCFYPESDELLLGDIVICSARMKEQACEYGHSVKREFAFLLAHSLLHLCGYDHMTPEEAAQMEALQEQILQNLGITREIPD